MFNCFNGFKNKVKNTYNTNIVPPFYMVGDWFLTVMHSRIRNNCSNLHADLLTNHLRPNPTCQCSNGNEDAPHFFFDCEMYTNQRVKLFSFYKICAPIKH